MSDKLYTIAEMAKVLNIPESTVRFYRDRYSEYIPYTGEGRKKRYLPEALDALRIIAELSGKSEPQESIAEQLNIHFTRFIEFEKETAVTTAGEQQQYDIKEMLTLMTTAISTVADQKKQIDFLLTALENSNDRVTAIEQQLTAVQEKQAQTEIVEAHIKELDTKLLSIKEQMEDRKKKSKGFFSRWFKDE